MQRSEYSLPRAKGTIRTVAPWPATLTSGKTDQQIWRTDSGGCHRGWQPGGLGKPPDAGCGRGALLSPQARNMDYR